VTGTPGCIFGLVGVNGSAGLVFNPSTWEICAYVMGCARPGFGMFAGAGVQVGGSILGPHCGKDLNGRSIKVALDITSPAGGLGGSAGQNNGAGVSVAVKPSIGAGFSAGVDICQMKILKCWNTPSDCKPCSK
jgi:hypothetical protein